MATAQPRSLLQLPFHYLEKGNQEKYRTHLDRALAELDARGPDALPAGEAGTLEFLRDPATAAGFFLYNHGRLDELAQLAAATPGNAVLASMGTAALLRLGRHDQLQGLAPGLANPAESLLKLKTAIALLSMPRVLSPEPRVHVLLLCHNRRDYVGEALRQLARTAYANYALYIADNGSSDGSWPAIQEAAAAFAGRAPVEMERLPTNIGRPAGHNWLLTRHDHAAADYIAIADDDLVAIPPTWLADMVRTAKAFPRAAVVGGKSLNPGLPKVIHGGVRKLEVFEEQRLKLSNEKEEADWGQYDYIDKVDHVIGCLHIYDAKALFGEIGLFDIRFSPAQCVDIEHHLRTRLAGHEIIYNGLVEFTHLRAMGKQVGRGRAWMGNSLGNVLKLLHKYDPTDMQRFIAEQDEAWRAWLTGD